MASDYYALLGVAPDADEEAILQAYREQAAEHHPDVSDDPDAEARFRRLNRAKEVLTDPERRRAYDRLGHERFVEHEASDDHPPDRDDVGRRGSSGPAPSAGGVDLSAGLGSLIDRLIGAARGRRGVGRSGSRAVGWSPLEVDLEDAVRGAAGGPGRSAGRRRDAVRSGSRDDDPARGRECPKCGGRGTFVHVLDTARGRTRRLEPCERCDGTGTVAD